MDKRDICGNVYNYEMSIDIGGDNIDATNTNRRAKMNIGMTNYAAVIGIGVFRTMKDQIGKRRQQDKNNCLKKSILNPKLLQRHSIDSI